MDRVKQPKFARKAGGQIPAVVKRMMARRHPNVQILWHNQLQRWALVQKCQGKDFMIRLLGDEKNFEAPSLANTVYVLDRTHPANFATAAARDKLLAMIDQNPALVAAKARAADAIREGSSDLWHLMKQRVRVRRPS